MNQLLLKTLLIIVTITFVCSSALGCLCQGGSAKRAFARAKASSQTIFVGRAVEVVNGITHGEFPGWRIKFQVAEYWKGNPREEIIVFTGPDDCAAYFEVGKNIWSLEPDNSLRHSLESGARGDMVHHAWMEKMKELGFKQASYRISFEWRGKIESLKIKGTWFLRRYYRFDSQIRDRQLLRNIKDSGVEGELREAVLARARKSVVELMKNKPSPAHGILYLNLLDDEALPILDEMPLIEW